MNKQCPISQAACVEYCAWWMPESEVCAIFAIAVDTDILSRAQLVKDEEKEIDDE